MTHEELPSSVDAERAVLGSLIAKPDLLDLVVAWVRYSDAFWRNQHKRVFNIMLDMSKNNVHIDSITLYNRFKDKYNEDISSLIKEMTEATSLNNIEHHAKIIWQRFVQRKTMEAARKIDESAKKGEQNIDALLHQHEKWIEELRNLQPNRSRDITTVTEEAVKNIEQGDDIIEFGLPYLDDSAGGMTRGEITALGGRPGHGKTTLIYNIVDSLARQGLKIAVFNREMTNTAGIKKLFILNSKNLKYDMLRHKKIPKEVLDEINELKPIIMDKYKNVTFYDDVRDLDTTIREIKRIEPDVFIDDYIQLAKVNGKKRDRRFEIEEIMQEYKWLSKRINGSGLLVSQLSRDIEKRIDPTPVMGDYAEGGTIEQISENCHFVYYPYNHNPMDNHPNQIEIIVKKARYGQIGTYLIGYDGNKCKFYEERNK